MAIFEGAGVAIITPFHTDGSIDYDKFGEVIEQQIANQTDAIIVCGTTGESATMTHEEHLDVIRYCVEKVAHRIPVVAGTGSNCTETAVYLSQEAEKIGADGLLVVTPYYNKATQNGLYQHFKMVADSVKRRSCYITFRPVPVRRCSRRRSCACAGMWKISSVSRMQRGISARQLIS